VSEDGLSVIDPTHYSVKQFWAQEIIMLTVSVKKLTVFLTEMYTVCSGRRPKPYFSMTSFSLFVCVSQRFILVHLKTSFRSRDFSVDIATRLRAGRSGFNSRRGLVIYLLATASRPALEPTQPLIQWVPGAFSRG
jgi:hypothetical protein